MDRFWVQTNRLYTLEGDENKFQPYGFIDFRCIFGCSRELSFLTQRHLGGQPPFIHLVFLQPPFIFGNNNYGVGDAESHVYSLGLATRLTLTRICCVVGGLE